MEDPHHSHITGGADADDELSCWEGPSKSYSSDEERVVVREISAVQHTTNLPEVKVRPDKLLSQKMCPDMAAVNRFV